MDELPYYSELKYHPDTLNYIRKMFDLDKPGRMEKAIDILEEWINRQQHFESKNFDRGYLEVLIISCKGSLEMAKTKIDKLCTMRTLAPEYFEAELVQMKMNRIRCLYSVMPMLTQEYHRIFVAKLLPGDYTPEDQLNIYRDWIINAEFTQRHSYSLGYIFVNDLRDANIQIVASAFNFNVARKFMTVLQEGYGIRLKCLHILSNSKAIETLVNIIKPVLPDKVAKRVYIHSTLESLHEMIPKELLSKDLGGDEKSLVELYEIGVNNVTSKEHKEYMTEALKQRTDESKRIGDKVEIDFLPGTFRSLNVD